MDMSGDGELMIDGCVALFKLIFGPESWERWNEIRMQTQHDTIRSFVSWLLDLAQQQLEQQDQGFTETNYSDADVLADLGDGDDVNLYTTKSSAPTSDIVFVDYNSPPRPPSTYITTHMSQAVVSTDQSELDIMFIAQSQSFFCRRCAVSLAGVEVIREHVRIRHSTDAAHLILSCTCCQQKFPSIEDYVSYHRTLSLSRSQDPNKPHTAGKGMSGGTRASLVCSFCAKSFTQHKTLTEHVANIHEKAEPKHECLTCGKKFRYARSLRGHRKKCGVQLAITNHALPGCTP